jgi:predicted ATPase
MARPPACVGSEAASALRLSAPARARCERPDRDTRTGYTLVLGAEELDSARFERLVTEGRTAVGNPARARRALGRALALWRGPALQEFADEEFARAEAGRLEELRVDAIEDRVEADLALGNHEDLIPELHALIGEFPLRERLWRQLMLALYRAGRQAEALEGYREARRVLSDELGLEPGDELRQLQAAILRQEPALVEVRRREGVRTNLPASLTPLLGRERDLASLVELLRYDAVRLVTLTGAGGAGKTTLAIEVARLLADDFASGVFLVELAPIRDATLVPGILASTLGVEPAPGESPLEAMRRHLADEELLLVVDNAEHLPEIGPLLVDLLHAAPDVRLLVTSRAVLHLSGERVYPVPPLDPEPAIQLFLARAQAAHPSFAPEASKAPLLRQICSRLDRLPLAIELAAPHTGLLSLEALYERLAQRLRLLTRGPRDLPARQQTLAATLEWSYELLAAEERQAFRRLSVFAGSFAPEAAEVVAVTNLATLEVLLEHNLVSSHEQGRLALLETVREYARERLDASGEGDEIRDRHLHCVLEIARSANVTIEADGPMRHDVVIRERNNLSAALDWARASDQVELGLELATVLENYWVTNDPLEGRRRLGDLLERAGSAPSSLRAHALRVHAATALMLGEYDDAKRGYELSLADYRAVGDTRGVAIVLGRLAFEELRRDDVERARALAEESLQLSRAIGFAKGEAVALGAIADVKARYGKDEQALDLLERSAGLSLRTGFPWVHVRILARISDLLLRRGQIDEAAARIREALPLLRQMGDRPSTVDALARLAALAAHVGQPEQAGRLWGAVEAEEIRNPHGDWGSIRARFEKTVLAADGPEFRAGRTAGQHLSLESAIELTLSNDAEATSVGH